MCIGLVASTGRVQCRPVIRITRYSIQRLPASRSLARECAGRTRLSFPGPAPKDASKSWGGKVRRCSVATSD